MHRSRVAVSQGSSVPNLLRDLYTDFHSGCCNSHSCQQYLRVRFPKLPCQHLLPFVFLMTAILAGGIGNLNVVLICISLMASGVEHFHMSTGNSKWIKGLDGRPKTVRGKTQKPLQDIVTGRVFLQKTRQEVERRTNEWAS